MSITKIANTKSGSIEATAIYTQGIYLKEANGIINNSILFSYNGLNSLTILKLSGNMILNLHAGSRMIGHINLGGRTDNDTVNVFSGGVSGTLSFVNTENINLDSGFKRYWA